jgi:hypothetical protein
VKTTRRNSMKYRKDVRMENALVRRKQNVEDYEKLLTVSVPQTFEKETFINQKEWIKFISKKLALAEKEVAILQEKLSQVR